jgi:hypothetical protein
MNNRRNESVRSFTVADAAEACVAARLEAMFAEAGSLLGDLNPWTQRLIMDENLAKLALVFEAEEPAEACYRDLIREIDTEAESGIYLARPGSGSDHLDRAIDERGVSGRLCHEIEVIAPVIFADELAHSADDYDLVWVTIEARHDRANVDATISELIMSHLLDDANAARDMANAIRALHYAFHEDRVRRRCDLPPVLDSRERRDVEIMVGEFVARSGSYEARTEEIRQRVESHLRQPFVTARTLAIPSRRSPQEADPLLD